MIFTSLAARSFLKRYWRVLAVVVLLGAALSLYSCQIDQAEQRGYDRAIRKGEAALAKREREIAADEAKKREISRAHDIHFQQVTRDLQSRIDDLTARNIDLGRLRVRPRVSCPAAAGSTAAAAEPDGAAGQPGHDLPPGDDPERELGLQLVRYAGECERYREQVMGLQAWIEESLQNRASVNHE
jgi:hypothetical protein